MPSFIPRLLRLRSLARDLFADAPKFRDYDLHLSFLNGRKSSAHKKTLDSYNIKGRTHIFLWPLSARHLLLALQGLLTSGASNLLLPGDFS